MELTEILIVLILAVNVVNMYIGHKVTNMFINDIKMGSEILSISFDSVSQKNTCAPKFKPMGQVIGFQCLVIDKDENQKVYAAEFVEDDKRIKLNIISEKPIDLSESRVITSYIHHECLN